MSSEKNKNRNLSPETVPFWRKNKKCSSLVELIIVTVLFAVLIPSSLGMFVSARKITGQSYIQHLAAIAMGEADDILRYMKNMGFELLPNGEFFLIRNPGTGSWLVKSDLPDRDIYERHVAITDALRHSDTKALYLPGDTGSFYADPDTKKIEISILWAPDYIPVDVASHTLYLTHWQKTVEYPST